MEKKIKLKTGTDGDVLIEASCDSCLTVSVQSVIPEVNGVPSEKEIVFLIEDINPDRDLTESGLVLSLPLEAARLLADYLNVLVGVPVPHTGLN